MGEYKLLKFIKKIDVKRSDTVIPGPDPISTKKLRRLQIH
jgi:hypothetical protein